MCIYSGAARHLVQHFKRLSEAAQALLASQSGEGSPLKLIMDVSTRWNSTYLMLARLCKLQHHVRKVLNDDAITRRTDASHLELRDQHWLLLQNLVEVLKPIKVNTTLRALICCFKTLFDVDSAN